MNDTGGGRRAAVGRRWRAAAGAVVALLLATPVLAQVPADSTTDVAEYLAVAAAADTSGGTPLQDRARAIQALGRSCSQLAVQVLGELGRPYLRPWIIWHTALTALSRCPREDLAPFWREMITFPREPVREIAIVGLLRTGTRGDVVIIQEATHRETDPAIMRLAARADSVLRLPTASRATLLPK